MQNMNHADWAKAIATRISDEWHGKTEFPEDAEILNNIIEKFLKNNPNECKKLIGTGIIEETYFEPL